MKNHQDEDLAYVQDVAFVKIASYAGEFLLDLFHQHSKKKGRVTDLGCASAKALNVVALDGYQVTGIDFSMASIELAKKLIPSGNFICGSIVDVDIPKSQYIISTDITLNYLPKKHRNDRQLKRFFKKIYNALLEDGLFVFDILIENDDMPSRSETRFFDSSDWTIFVNRIEDRQAQTITREITLFRKMKDLYRKSQRTDITTAYNLGKIILLLEEVGFSVNLFDHYGSFKFRADHVGVQCKK